MALFQVSRDIRLAAQQVFYSNALLTIHNDQLEFAFDFVHRPTVAHFRRVSFAITPAQCYFWAGYRPAAAHPQWDLEHIVEAYFPKGPYRSESSNPAKAAIWPYACQVPSTGFRAALDVLAAVDVDQTLPPLDLEIDLSALWVYAALYLEPGGGDDPDDLEDRFGWVYDLYLDVAHAIHQAFTCPGRRRLGSICFELSMFNDMAPWLVREVMGDRFTGSVQGPMARLGRARLLQEKVPRYHSADYLGGGRQLCRPNRWG